METRVFLSASGNPLASSLALFPLAGKAATAGLYGCLGMLQMTGECVGGSDSWERKKWGERRTGCWVKLFQFKLEQHTF